MSWQTPDETPLRPTLGLFLQIDGASEPAIIYRQATDLIQAAEELGYSSARVTQHHFGERNGWLPSPLPFLTAVGQRAKRIHLGTVVVTVPLEQPVRLAEDAAVTDLLLDGRLELGLGSGLGGEIFAAFGQDFERRREQTQVGIDRLQAALLGERLKEGGSRLQPPDPALSERLWFAVMSENGARYAASRGLGLLLGRVEHGGGSPVANQTRTARLYRESLGARAAIARIAAGRTVYPAKDRTTALRDLALAFEPTIAAYKRGGFVPAEATLPEVLTRLHVLYGHPQEIAQTLTEEQAQIGWTELLVQVDPGAMPPAKARQALEQVALEIEPYLGAITTGSEPAQVF